MAQEYPFVVNANSVVAVYTQVKNQVRFGIASGRLKPGDELPSAREMSQRLKVNPNTITKAYRDLELLQLVHARRGIGVTISERAPKLSGETTRAMVMGDLADAVAECTAAGVSPAEIRKTVSEAIASRALPYRAAKRR